MGDDLPWMIVQEPVGVYGKSSAFVGCDRRQHLLILKYPANKNASISSNSSTISVSDISDISSTRSTRVVDVQIVIYLERIQYIQRSGNVTSRRSARNYNSNRWSSQTNKTDQHERNDRVLEIFYSTENPRTEYLYKSVSFQLIIRGDEFDKWVNALFTVIDEAKNLNEAARRNRWFLREYEKLRNSSKGLTVDSIHGWLNSHLGLVGERKTIEELIIDNQSFIGSKEITEMIFKKIYYHFYDKQQEILMNTLMSDLIEQDKINLRNFALRITNNKDSSFDYELENMRKFFKIEHEQLEIPFEKCYTYLWSDANSVFDPISRTMCTDDMDQPLNHYWISSSHNTYLAKTQIFNPASHHCYIQALLKGCRCIEIDVVDGRPGLEPEVTHRNTRVKPISLREVLEAIHDYAFVASEYPLIISIENHCSSEQRSSMAKMFIEILGDYLLQSPLSPNETQLPTPNQLKRKILLKDTKINNPSFMGSQTSIDSEELQDLPSVRLEGHVQLFDFGKKIWVPFTYSLIEDDLFLAKDDENQQKDYSSDEFSDDEDDNNSIRHKSKKINDEYIQIWYHGNISHQDARSLLLSNAGHEIGTFLVRKSANKNCYCISFLAFNSEVKSIEIHETQDEDGKCLYSLSQKKFESISDLVSHYRTYDFAEIFNSTKQTLYRLGRPLPRKTWKQELDKQSWYQPSLSRQQAVDLLNGIGEEMTYLIRESSRRTNQEHTMSVYVNGGVRHLPIYRDGSDLMLMSKTFTSLVELVQYFSCKPIFDKLTLKKPAKSYEDFLNDQHRNETQGTNKEKIMQKSLDCNISLKVGSLQTLKANDEKYDREYQVQLLIYEGDRNKTEVYLLKFETVKDLDIFSKYLPANRIPTMSSSSISNRSHQEISTNHSEKIPIKSHANLQSQIGIQEFSKLIIYCQGVKLKELNINKASDLLGKINSCKEMISLSSVKGTTFCMDIESMIQFNQGHFTRIYPDFSKKSWNSYNFEPHLYWLAGCQMIALNFQMPDRPMHINAGRFAANGGCGYVLMPNSIRSYDTHKLKIKNFSLILKIRIIAVKHLRTTQAKSIVKIHVKTTIIKKQKLGENPTFTTIFNGPCGIWDSKQSSKHHDQMHSYNELKSEDSEVDLIYFEVWTDNQEFCGQSVVPISSLRRGIRSIQLYDKFNERLDMSALLIDIHLDPVIIR